jgi:hypothetical protein
VLGSALASTAESCHPPLHRRWLALATGSARSWLHSPFRSPCTLVLGGCFGDRICWLVARNATRPCTTSSGDRIRLLVAGCALAPTLLLLLNPCAWSSLVTRPAHSWLDTLPALAPPALVTRSAHLWLDPRARSCRWPYPLVGVTSMPPPLLLTKSTPPPPPVCGWWQDTPPVAIWRLHGFTIS